MITQTIKQWLDNLFAWWPWKRNAMTAFTSQRRDGAIGNAQEPLWHVPGDGPLPLPDVTVVAVKQDDDAPSAPNSSLRPSSVEARDKATFSTTSHDPPSLLSGSDALLHEQNPSVAPPRSTLEQQLGFLRYLVERGLINEGFEEGKLPTQYCKKKHP